MKTYRLYRRGFAFAALAAIIAGCSGGPGTSAVPAAGAQAKKVQPDTPIWYRYVYGPSGNLVKNEAMFSGGTASFNFKPNLYVALLTTQGSALTGDLTGMTLTDTVGVTGSNYPFVTQYGGSCSSAPTTRFFFHASGSAYTRYWWSNPESFKLQSGSSATLTASLTDPSQWSDWNGKNGTQDPSAFFSAVGHVIMIGLSYGGGCFFENGATISGGSAVFSSHFTEAPST
ncbi:MAG TPA: hypothetical protein VGX91_04160 [Candidatus Cybelea sp.]|jgi:hypothetical protein|nr:hypothetical protein [Candidatus Cybelea sp.]